MDSHAATLADERAERESDADELGEPLAAALHEGGAEGFGDPLDIDGDAASDCGADSDGGGGSVADAEADTLGAPDVERKLDAVFCADSVTDVVPQREALVVAETETRRDALA